MIQSKIWESKWVVVYGAETKKHFAHPMRVNIPNGYKIIRVFEKGETARHYIDVLNKNLNIRKIRRKNRRQRGDLSEYNCKKKIRFAKSEYAIHHRDRLVKRYKRKNQNRTTSAQTPYECEHCKCWHLTTRK